MKIYINKYKIHQTLSLSSPSSSLYENKVGTTQNNIKFSNVRKMKTNGFQQNVDETKATSVVKWDTITTSFGSHSCPCKVTVDINEIRQKGQERTNILTKIKGFCKNIAGNRGVIDLLEMIESCDCQQNHQ